MYIVHCTNIGFESFELHIGEKTSAGIYSIYIYIYIFIYIYIIQYVSHGGPYTAYSCLVYIYTQNPRGYMRS